MVFKFIFNVLVFKFIVFSNLFLLLNIGIVIECNFVLSFWLIILKFCCLILISFCFNVCVVVIFFLVCGCNCVLFIYVVNFEVLRCVVSICFIDVYGVGSWVFVVMLIDIRWCDVGECVMYIIDCLFNFLRDVDFFNFVVIDLR